jgi:uncharacterized hydrophobic protein (TIGR00271 family)
MFEGIFNNITEAEKNDAIESIIENATPRLDFFLMLTLSISMAAFGMILGSTIIVVGSMLIAPILSPLLSLALGIILIDRKLMSRSFYTLIKSVFLAVIAGSAIGFLFSTQNIEGILPFIGHGTPFPLMYAIVAAIAGFAGAFAATKPHLNSSLPGVAIAVALVPPLAASGIAISLLDFDALGASLVLFLVNCMGVVFSCMIVFSLMQFASKKEGDKIIKEENSPAA